MNKDTYLNEVSISDAAKNFQEGKDVYALKQIGDNQFNLIKFSDIIQDCRFLIAVPKDQSNVTKPKKRRCKSVDIGKIQALKNAGWSQKDVADDLKCSISTVRLHWN